MTEQSRSARDYAGASLRDLTTRYLDLLDAGVRDRLDGKPPPMHQALDRLAVSEAISRYVRDGRQIDILAALNAGANWKHVADVLDVPTAPLHAEFRQWVDGQRGLYDALQLERPGSAPIGLSAAHGDAALRLAANASERDGRRYGRD